MYKQHTHFISDIFQLWRRCSASSADICGLKISSIKEILTRTAEDCTAPLAKYVGNAICCPQFKSMLQIFKGEHSFISGSLVLNNSDAIECIAEIMSVLIENGANTSITELCNIQPTNMTGGLCPVTSVKKFEKMGSMKKEGNKTRRYM